MSDKRRVERALPALIMAFLGDELALRNSLAPEGTQEVKRLRNRLGAVADAEYADLKGVQRGKDMRRLDRALEAAKMPLKHPDRDLAHCFGATMVMVQDLMLDGCFTPQPELVEPWNRLREALHADDATAAEMDEANDRAIQAGLEMVDALRGLGYYTRPAPRGSE